MQQRPTLPRLSQLRQSGATPHYFGLGFIQLKLDTTRRLHFWVPHWPVIPGADTELHNHRYSFSSTVLQGTLVQEIFRLPTDQALRANPRPGDLEVVEVSCQPGAASEPQVLGYAAPRKVLHLTTHAGGQYRLDPIDFHRAFPQGDVITRLDRQAVESQTARVLRPPGSAFACPFSIEKTQDECWAEIERMLARS